MKKHIKSFLIVFGLLCLLSYHSNTYPSEDSWFVPLSSEENLLTQQMKWEVWDNPGSRDGPSQWGVMLTETSGIKNHENKSASMLLTGDKSWGDYSIQTSFIRFGEISLYSLISQAGASVFWSITALCSMSETAFIKGACAVFPYPGWEQKKSLSDA